MSHHVRPFEPGSDIRYDRDDIGVIARAKAQARRQEALELNKAQGIISEPVYDRRGEETYELEEFGW